MNNVLSTLQNDLLFDIESNVRSKLNTIVEELKIGKTDSLQTMSYFVCGDPSAMKTYEIETYLINEELSLLKPSQLSLLWLATEDGAGYEDSDLNELPYEEYEVFNYVYNNMDLYDSSYYTHNDFLELLDRQCWLQTTVSECEIAYQKLHDEIINKIQYDDFNILVPNFVDSIEDIQFYYIYGSGVDNLTFKEYERHILYKLVNLIKKERINESFFRELASSYEGFDLYWDNYEFYSFLPPIYFAQKIMETDEFRFPLDFHIDKKIEFINLNSQQIENIAKENDEEVNDVISKILETTIFDISNYGSEEYNRLVYDNCDERYDHDLSRFLQYKHTLENTKEEGTRLQIYTSLKKELEDDHNTIRPTIEDFIEKEFAEYENGKYSLNAVKVPIKEKNTFSAVKPHVIFPNVQPKQNKINNNSDTKRHLDKSKILKNLKALFLIIPIGILVIIYAYFGFKSMVYSAWHAPTYPTTYSVQGDDNRSLTMIFLPNNKTYIIYSDEEKEYLEISLDQMRGVYATNYFGRLWYFDAPGLGFSFWGPFGYRIYPKGVKPVIMETTVLNKYRQGSGKSTLSEIGERVNLILLFSDHAVRFEDMWLQKVETDPKFLDVLNQKMIK